MSYATLYWALIVAALASGAAAPPIAAQGTSTCPDVAARVTAGQPNADDLSLLMNCPTERSTAFVAYLQSIKASTDLAALDEPFEFANHFRDGDVYTALSSIASDASASSTTRSLSLLALIYVENGSTSLDYTRLTSVVEGTVCQVGGSSTQPDPLFVGTPLPVNHQARSGALAGGLARDGSAPADVRSAARCLAAAAGYELLPGLESLPGGDPTKLTLVYVCGNKFAIRNANFTPGIVTYQVQKSKETGAFTVPPRTRTKLYGEISFITAIKGTVTLFYQGSQIQTRSNGNTTCP